MAACSKVLTDTVTTLHWCKIVVLTKLVGFLVQLAGITGQAELVGRAPARPGRTGKLITLPSNSSNPPLHIRIVCQNCGEAAAC